MRSCLGGGSRGPPGLSGRRRGSEAVWSRRPQRRNKSNGREGAQRSETAVTDDDGRRRFLNAPGELVGDVRLELRDVENGVDCAEVVR